jgi:hypothetical protein
MRLCARIGELGRVEVPALHLANQAEDRPVPKLLPLQSGGEVEQECITACPRQRPRRIEHCGELEVGERNRPHVAPEASCRGIQPKPTNGNAMRRLSTGSQCVGSDNPLYGLSRWPIASRLRLRSLLLPRNAK